MNDHGQSDDADIRKPGTQYVVAIRDLGKKKYDLYLMGAGKSPEYEGSGGRWDRFSGAHKSASRMGRKRALAWAEALNTTPRDKVQLPYAIAVPYDEIIKKHEKEDQRLTATQEGSLRALKHYGKQSKYRLKVVARASASTQRWLLQNKLAVFDVEKGLFEITAKGAKVLKAGSFVADDDCIPRDEVEQQLKESNLTKEKPSSATKRRESNPEVVKPRRTRIFVFDESGQELRREWVTR